ncbi:MAG: leucine--tRNA ligase [Myxococcota bacterium]
MAERYTPSEIEPKWQAYWESNKTFRTSEDPLKAKRYILDMFPYPSGSGLHVGHPEGYTATDIMSRYLRSTGHSVLHPMGWDAFGLPAEQHAIRTGTHPRTTTAKNIATFRRQLKMLGFSYDWEREIDTTDPSYVRWTQWIFLKLFERGLAYQEETPVNWCPELGTVLSNEEVKDGLSELGGFPVERVPLRQWMLRITAYADVLLDDLSRAQWPESTRTMQREWIGRSVGAQIQFAIPNLNTSIEVFTTRPDTLFGATFMVLAPEHPLVSRVTTEQHRSRVDTYVAQAARKSELDRKSAREKTGVFTGGYCLHPLSGADVPIWIGDYVLWGYGTGAVMAVPAHDARDYEFAQRYELPIHQVVRPGGATENTEARTDLDEAFVEPGVVFNSGKYDGMTTEECKVAIVADLEASGGGRKRVEFKLRDWVFSRQRYWGEPIPIYFPVETQGDPRKGDPHTIRYDDPVPVPLDELPLNLPELEDFKPGEDPSGPLARAVDWRFFQRDGKWFARETNTMPQWAGSCWYYLRFMDPHNAARPWSEEAAQRWLPVDLYVGGAEHAVLHLLYARFWHKVLFDEGLVSVPEPFARLVHQGMILGEIEYTIHLDASGNPLSKEAKKEDRVSSRRVDASEVRKNKNGEFVLLNDPAIAVDARAHKMSKSRGNVVNPDLIVQKYGADSMRIYEMFMGPLEATKPWSTASISGVRRFLDRCWELASRVDAEAEATEELRRLEHRTIKAVTEQIDQLKFNTAVSQMMVFRGELAKCASAPAAQVRTLSLLLHPFAPHLAEEMWEMLGYPPSIQHVPWPEYDPDLCEDSVVEVPVQVNGKVRAKLQLPKDADEATALQAAHAQANVALHLEGKNIRKVIWVPGRILNLIARS